MGLFRKKPPRKPGPDSPKATYQSYVVDLDGDKFQVFAPNTFEAVGQADRLRKKKGKKGKVKKIDVKKKGGKKGRGR